MKKNKSFVICVLLLLCAISFNNVEFHASASEVSHPKTVLVTGGAGYIGSHTTLRLLEEGYNVVVADNYCNSSPESLLRVKKLAGKDFKAYDCDICDRAGLEKILSENKIDAVIHFAGLKAVGESCKIPLKYYENNVFGTVVLCQVMQKFNVKQMIFSSSATVYGNNKVPYVEDMQIGDVSNPYGRTKFIIEEMLGDLYNSDKSWKIILLRYFNPVGAHESGEIGEDPNGLPNNLMPYVSKVAVGKLPRLTVFGDDYPTPDGTCIRDYIHVVDLANGHVKALQKLDEINKVEAYNLGRGCGVSVLEIIRAFENASGQKVNFVIGSRRAGDLPESYADTSKAQTELGWQAHFDINKMCADSWRWQSKNPDGYKTIKDELKKAEISVKKGEAEYLESILPRPLILPVLKL